MWPGNLINPRQVEYVGEAGLEYQHGKFDGFSFPPPFCTGILLPVSCFFRWQDLFDGFIEYGVEMRCDYRNVVGKNVIIHGHGAFTMEPLGQDRDIENKRNPVATCDGAICSERFGFFWVLFQKIEQERQDHANELEDLSSVQHVVACFVQGIVKEQSIAT